MRVKIDLFESRLRRNPDFLCESIVWIEKIARYHPSLKENQGASGGFGPDRVRKCGQAYRILLSSHQFTADAAALSCCSRNTQYETP
jgi:hypothetical protein